MLNYALRVNLTIAIVAMVVDKPTPNATPLIITNATGLALNDTLAINGASEAISALASSSSNLATTTSAQSLVALENTTTSLVDQVSYI